MFRAPYHTAPMKEDREAIKSLVRLLARQAARDTYQTRLSGEAIDMETDAESTDLQSNKKV